MLVKSEVYRASFGLESRRGADVSESSLLVSSASSTAGVGGIPITGVSGRLADLVFSQLLCLRRSPLSSVVGLSPVIRNGVTDFGCFLGCFFGCLLWPRRQPLLFGILFVASLVRCLVSWAVMGRVKCKTETGFLWVVAARPVNGNGVIWTNGKAR